MEMFSKRYGYVEIKSLQIESMDNELRNSLWICIEDLLNQLHRAASDGLYEGLLDYIWTDYFKQPKSKLIGANDYHIVHSEIQPRFYKFSWHEVYSFLEFIAGPVAYCNKDIFKDFSKHCNRVLERESAGWRFVDELIWITLSHLLI